MVLKQSCAGSDQLFLCSITGSLLGGHTASFPGPGSGPLSSGKMTLLGNPSERCHSTCSTLSSVYTLSRRSSGISPGFSSRRSSQTSRLSANQPRNMSSADFYDPISADISRRSSQASQGEANSIGPEGRGPGLPNPLNLTPAQHYCLQAKYAAATGEAPPTPLPYVDQAHLKSSLALFENSQESSGNKKVLSRQYSAAWSLMPRKVSPNIPRRASDPGRPLDPLSQLPFQKYRSVGSLSRGVTVQPHPPPATDRHFPQPSCLRLDGLHGHPYGLQPPSISENTTMETRANINEDATRQVDFQRGPNVHQQWNVQRRMNVVNLNKSKSLAQIQDSSPRGQWDIVSSGLLDGTQQCTKLDLRGNLDNLRQNQNFRPFSPTSNKETVENLSNRVQQRCLQLSSESVPNTFQQSFNLNDDARPEHRFCEGTSSYDRNGNLPGGTNVASCKQEPAGMDFTAFEPVQVKTEDGGASVLVLDKRNCNLTRTQDRLKPITEPRSVRLLRLKFTQQTDEGSALPCRHKDNVLHYTGQIQVFEPNSYLGFYGSNVVNPLEPDAAAPELTGTQPDRTSGLEQTQIDFDSLLNNGDQPSFVLGTLSPGLFQSSSQSSSGLTTPRSSASLPSVSAGPGNMAIGDMSSLLTALAEENKFLNLIS